MGGRLLGQETESAIRFAPFAVEGRRAHHALIHRALMRAMARRVSVREGRRRWVRKVPEEAVWVAWRAVRVRRTFRARMISLERK